MNILLRRGVLTSIMLISCSLLYAQKSPIEKADYRMAERFSPNKMKSLVFSLGVTPRWLKSGDKFWYNYKTTEGTSYYIVDLNRGSKKPLFDNHKFATQLTLITQDPYDLKHIPNISPEFIDGDRAFRFDIKSSRLESVEEMEFRLSQDKLAKGTVEDKEEDSEKGEDGDESKKSKKSKDKPKIKVFHLEYNLDTETLSEVKDWKKEVKDLDWANISPDRATVLFARDYNLFWMDSVNYQKALKDSKDSTIVEHQITTEGVKNYSYGGGYSPDSNESIKVIEKEMKKRRSAWVVWSQDSKRFALTRSDNRNMKDLWVIDVLKEPRPKLETYKYQMPGEQDSTEVELIVFDNETKEQTNISVGKYKNQGISICQKELTNKDKLEKYTAAEWLSSSSDKLYFTRGSRDLKRFDICCANLSSGEVTTIIEEKQNTYIDSRPPILLNGESELIHWSERDGWGHFYLYSIDGTLKRQITSGPWKSDEKSVRLDESSRTLLFTAQGRECGENPYYTHFYSVSLDGGDVKLLNSGNFTHSSTVSDSFKYFVNTYSRVDSAPISEVRDITGKVVIPLEVADLSNLFAAGYKFPKPFKAKAADGVTDIYGVMYTPFKMDSTKMYPLLEYVYPGPQSEAFYTAFSPRMDRTDRISQLGFVVISLGNRGGSPNRSQWYHTYGYGDLRDYGLADKKYVAEQMADRYDFIDIDKVGISGHSGGGFMSTAALCQYPDFFKVAVSSAGNHENNIYNRWWSERHHGVTEEINAKGDTTFVYNIERNSQLAKNLKGNLLLVTGDIDNNVHPGNTLRMANALIKANKRFDIFIMTGQRHGFGGHGDYFFWRKADYFCKHLIGDSSISTDIFEMNREHKTTASKKHAVD